MNHRPIVVYAIAKNEAQHVYRWYERVKTADSIIVVDTGSTDVTVRKLHQCAKVSVIQQTFDPFRFDVARNFALDAVPDGAFAVFFDLDDVPEPDWYDKLQAILELDPDLSAVTFVHEYSHDPITGTPTHLYNRLCAHRASDYIWRYPVHEVLVETVVAPKTYISDIRVVHKPDLEKVRDYMPLLLLGVQEIGDARTHRYLARELEGRGDFALASEHYRRAIELEDNQYQQAEMYVGLGNCYENLGEHEDAKKAFVYSSWTAPDVREFWAAQASYSWRCKEYQNAISATMQMFHITHRPDAAMIFDERYYREWPYHMIAVCYHALGVPHLAEINIDEAFRLAPNDNVIVADLIRIRNIPITNSSQEPSEKTE